MTITEMKALNKAAGYHFFDRATIRFFNSHVVSKLYNNELFITAEQCWNKKNFFYTIRRFNSDSSIVNMGDFQQYTSLSTVRKEARRLSRISKTLEIL